MRIPLQIRCGQFLFRQRNAVFPLALLALFAGFRPVYPLGSERFDRWLDLLGLAVAFAGQGLRAAVIGYAYIQRGGRHGQVYADRLVIEGFFGHSRNPLYLGNLLVLLGLFIIHNNPWVYALGGAFFLLAYSSIVAAEEAYLRTKFGEAYDAYCRRVNRWLPDFHGLGRSIEGMRFAWRRFLVKEYGSVYAWLATALVLLAYEALTHSDYQRERPRLIMLAVLLGLATAGWAAARFVKKGGLLIGEPPRASSGHRVEDMR